MWKLWIIISANVWANIHLFWNDFALQASKKAVNTKPLMVFFSAWSYKGSLMRLYSFTLSVFHVTVMENKTYHRECSILKRDWTLPTTGLSHQQWYLLSEYHSWQPSQWSSSFPSGYVLGMGVSYNISSWKWGGPLGRLLFSWWSRDHHCGRFSWSATCGGTRRHT